jgi:hypothetical protein
MSRTKSIQNVNKERQRWEEVIQEAKSLLQKAEERAIRLRGAINTFTELRDKGAKFNGPDSATQI